ncbi:MAG: response regulator [Candidatus Wallbacteria bacterium]|nr:response regulator [Candidatus Wallbacteria bacterium]
MLEFLASFFGETEFMAHGHCYLWTESLIVLVVGSNLLIALAYLSIPLVLVHFARKRKDLPFQWLFWLFGVFITLCGLTHVMDIVTIWHPVYWLDGWIRALTAIASVATAVAIVPVIPKALALRSPAELEAANRLLQDTNAQLVQAEAFKDEFLANVSHELRTPLTLILAPVESLIAGQTGPIAPPQREILNTVYNNSVRLLQMVNGLLDFSKFQAGRIQVQREPTRIGELTRSIFSDFEPLFRQKGLKGRLEQPDADTLVEMDRYLYERIVFNLLSNATKFTPAGGAITVSVGVSDSRLALSVVDTGVGIAESEQAHLFQKFRQVDGSTARRFEGTGLGLALVKEFAHLLGGTVSVRSAAGQGSTFRVDCLAPPALKTTEIGPQAQRRPALQPIVGDELPDRAAQVLDSRLARLLVAEDNRDLAAYIASLLYELCEIRIARDGEEAWELARDWRPDMVLSDVMMPRRDGLSLCRALKDDPGTCDIPVVLLTALTQRDSLMKGWEAGADDYLFKPFHPIELKARVRSMLAAVQARKMLESVRAQNMVALKRSNTDLQQFAYAASHDLRDPLRKIQAFGELLKEEYGPQLTAEAVGYIDRMRSAAVRMDVLISNLLALSRLTTHALPFEAVDLEKTAREVVSDLDESIRQSGATVELCPMPTIEAEPTQMRQLLQNLIGNALKFHRPGENPVVRVSARILEDPISMQSGTAGAGPVCEISVQDNGIGFDEKYLDRIFNVFERLHPRNQYEGTGVGLAICRKIADRHSGNITARSKLGEGSTFLLAVPVTQKQELFLGAQHGGFRGAAEAAEPAG